MKKIICLIISVSMLFTYLPAFALEDGTVNWDVRKNTYKSYGLEMPFRPAHKYVSEQNPPDFSWPYVDIAKSYNLVVCRDEAMTDIAYEKKGITLNVYNFDATFDIGTYYWSVQFETKDGRFSEWSDVRRFTLLPTAVPFPVSDIEAKLEKLKSNGHPRIAVNKNTLDEFRKLSKGVSKNFYESVYKTAEKYIGESIPSEPVCTNSAQAATMYREVQTMTAIIQRCAFTYLISKEERFGEFAVKALLEMANWDPEGATAYKWQDQAYRDIVVNTAYAYDWTYDLMTEEERTKVLEMLKVRMKVMAEISIGVTGEENGTLEKLPYGSHNWTAFGYLLLAAIATYGEIEDSEDYLKRGIPFYINVMAPWGGEDGGWSQGTGYWSASMTRHHDLNYTLKINDIINIYDKAFLRNHIYYGIYNFNPGGGATFGDGGKGDLTSDHQLVIKALSSLAGSEYAEWFYDYIGLEATNVYEKYFILDDSGIEGKMPVDIPRARHFRDIGWTSHHSELVDKSRISLFFKSSPYGSYNHSHPDQNSFVIHAYGEPLAFDSGYYDYYWSEFDLGYTRKTYAHNAITYDGGKGQPIHSKPATGEIVNFITHPDFDLVTGDATNAYTDKTIESRITDEPVLDKVLRHIIYVRPDMFIVIDDLKAKKDTESKFEWWLNAEKNIALYESGTGARIVNDIAALDAKIHYPENITAGYSDKFEGPDGIVLEPSNMSASTLIHKRVWFETPKVNETKIVSTLGVHPANEDAQYVKSYKMDNYIKLQCENGTYIYVKLDNSYEVILEDGTKFKGAALVVKDTSVMLVDGTYLYMDGKDIINSDKNVSVAFGKDELEISSYEDASIKLNIGEVNHIKNEKGIEIKENDESYGLKWNFKDGILSLNTIKNNYTLFLNNKHLPGRKAEDSNFKIDVDGNLYDVSLSGYINHDEENVLMGTLPVEGDYYTIMDINDVKLKGNAKSSDYIPLSSTDTVYVTGENPILKLKSFSGLKTYANVVSDHEKQKNECTSVVEAEDFISSVNGGAIYRTRAFLSGGAGVTTFNSLDGNMQWKFDVPESGYYDLAIKYVAWGSEDTKLQRIAKIGDYSGSLVLPLTQNYGSTPADWISAVAKVNVYLEKGENILTLYGKAGEWNFDWIGLIKR